MASLGRFAQKCYKYGATGFVSRCASTCSGMIGSTGLPPTQSSCSTQSSVQNYTAVPKSRFPQRKLFTPAVLNVSDRVKSAMLATDPGIRHADYIYAVQFLRSALLRIARAPDEDFTVIPLSGSGALGVESTLRTFHGSKRGKLIALENGAQGRKIVDMCHSSGINVKVIPVDLKLLQETLLSSNDITGVVTVHCEPYSGLVNPVNLIGEIVKKCAPNCLYFVDALTTFGAMTFDMRNIDFVVSNSCKCLQGAPGLAFVVARKRILEAQTYHGDSLVMDLAVHYDELQKTGQLRFTPPTHVINALREAVIELSDEGGVEGRAIRYKENNVLIKKVMAEMGFEQLYKDSENPEGFISTAFRYPRNPLFVFEEFRNRLNDLGFALTTSKFVPKNAFCVGNIGNLHVEDVTELMRNIRQVCHEMRMSVPIQQCMY